MQFFTNTHIDFMGRRHVAFVVSGILILAGLVSLFLRGGPDLGVDFKGGAVIQARFNKVVDPADISSGLQAAGFSNVAVRRGETDKEVVITTAEEESGTANISGSIRTTLIDKWQVDGRAINTEKVSPSVGRDLKIGAIKSAALALILILLYIWLRFEMRFAVAAIITLVHDVVITLGIFSILREEINLPTIAGFLTIIGYSLNDTIVVFDRIRENTRTRKGTDFGQIINDSINQTISRTVITSMTTLFAVISIFALARVGPLHTMSLALLIGVIVGTYSSIFVASPILHGWHLRLQKEKS